MAEKETALIQALMERQQATELQLSELSATVKALEARLIALGQPAAKASAAAQTAPAAPAAPRKPEVTPEVLVMLAAAATAYLGKEVRVRSAKMLQSPYEVVNPWAQQGRVFIQAAHNLRPRR